MSKQADLKSLTKVWYDKLKDEGFDDIEQDEDTLTTWSSVFYKSQFVNDSSLGNDTKTRYETKAVINEAKAQYYRLAEHFLNDHIFQTRLEKNIWALHVEGKSYREIAKTLRATSRKLMLNKDNVQIIVQKLEILMKEQLSHVEDRFSSL